MPIYITVQFRNNFLIPNSKSTYNLRSHDGQRVKIISNILFIPPSIIEKKKKKKRKHKRAITQFDRIPMEAVKSEAV